MDRLCVFFTALALAAGVWVLSAEAGAPAEKSVGCHGAKASCHGAKQAGCHGEPDAGGCHGRRSTMIQRAAARQESRQDSRAERRTARASCHGEKQAEPCECSDCDCCE